MKIQAFRERFPRTFLATFSFLVALSGGIAGPLSAQIVASNGTTTTTYSDVMTALSNVGHNETVYVRADADCGGGLSYAKFYSTNFRLTKDPNLFPGASRPVLRRLNLCLVYETNVMVDNLVFTAATTAITMQQVFGSYFSNLSVVSNGQDGISQNAANTGCTRMTITACDFGSNGRIAVVAQTNALIEKSLFSAHAGSGTYGTANLANGQVTVRSCTFRDNAMGVRAYVGTNLIGSNAFLSNTVAITLAYQGTGGSSWDSISNNHFGGMTTTGHTAIWNGGTAYTSVYTTNLVIVDNSFEVGPYGLWGPSAGKGTWNDVPKLNLVNDPFALATVAYGNRIIGATIAASNHQSNRIYTNLSTAFSELGNGQTLWVCADQTNTNNAAAGSLSQKKDVTICGAAGLVAWPLLTGSTNGSNNAAFALTNCTNVSISNLRFTDCFTALRLAGSLSNVVASCDFTSNVIGISMGLGNPGLFSNDLFIGRNGTDTNWAFYEVGDASNHVLIDNAFVASTSAVPYVLYREFDQAGGGAFEVTTLSVMNTVASASHDAATVSGNGTVRVAPAPATTNRTVTLPDAVSEATRRFVATVVDVGTQSTLAELARLTPRGVNALVAAQVSNAGAAVAQPASRAGSPVVVLLPRSASGSYPGATVTVVDRHGRAIRSRMTVPAGESAFAWDKLDDAGQKVKRGAYYLLVTSGGTTARAVTVVNE